MQQLYLTSLKIDTAMWTVLTFDYQNFLERKESEFEILSFYLNPILFCNVTTLFIRLNTLNIKSPYFLFGGG